MSWNVVSLVLACATGWSLLVLGYLPVTTVRQMTAEPIKGMAAWAIVAALAPPAIFHWYLIFAVICLIAWTKLERPAGKIWLAAAAALGLSLGIVFSLETSPELLGLKTPLALGLLYLGGATAGLAYVACLLARVEPTSSALRGCGRWLAICAVSATTLLGYAVQVPGRAPLFSFDSARHGRLVLASWTPLVPAAILVVLALLTWHAIRRRAYSQVRGLTAASTVAALLASLLAQLLLRTAVSAPFLASPN